MSFILEYISVADVGIVIPDASVYIREGLTVHGRRQDLYMSVGVMKD